MAEVRYKFNSDQNDGGTDPASEPTNEPTPAPEGGEPTEPKPTEPEGGTEPAPEPATEPSNGGEPTPEPQEPADPEPEDSELDDDALLSLLQKKGFKGKSLEDITKEKSPEPAKPSMDYYDEETKKFLEYQERTGRGLKDFNELNRDISKISPIDAAKDRIRRENEGVDLTDAEINYSLEEELGFDPTEELDEKEQAKFKRYYGSHLNTLKKEQQKYDEPVEGFDPNKAQEPSQPESGEKLKLSNGEEVDADTYNTERQKYLADRDASLQTIGEEKFNLTYDGKDGKKDLSFDYKYTDEDLQSMKSITEDVGGILSDYQDESGEFDHASFNKNILWSKPEFRTKAITALISKARSEFIAEQTGKRKNRNFDAPTEPPKPEKSGYAKPGEGAQSSGPRVKYSL